MSYTYTYTLSTYTRTRAAQKEKLCTYLSLPEAEVGVADGCEEHLDAHLQAPRRRHLHLLHRQRLARAPRHRRCTSTATMLSQP